MGAAKVTALVAQKFHLGPLGRGQGFQMLEVLIQPKIRHHIGKGLPVQLPKKVLPTGQDLGGGADAAPVVKIFPVLPEQGQKQPVELVKLKQPRQMENGLLQRIYTLNL